MEEKDINNIAGAVTSALAKLDTAAKEKEINLRDTGKEITEEVFKCPECDAPVKAGIAYCAMCGCPLEWEA